MSRLNLLDAPRFGALPDTAWTPPTLSKWDTTVDELRQHPDEWAAIATLPARSSLGKEKDSLARRGVETCQRSNGDGTATIWARYVGIDNVPAPVGRTKRHGTPGVMHAIDFRLPDTMPGPLVWAPPTAVAS